MTEPSASIRLKAAQEFTLRLGHADIGDAMNFVSPDVLYRVPGRHALAGSFHGSDEVLKHLLELSKLGGGTLDAYKFEDWLVGENSVGAVVDVRMQGHGAIITERIVFLFGFDGSDRISEINIFFQNEDAIERFFGN